MKRFKSMMMSIIAVFAICFLFVSAVDVQAAVPTEEKVPGKIYVNAQTTTKGKWKNILKKRVVTFVESSFDVEYAAGDKIDKLKVNKKGLDAKVTYSTVPNAWSTTGESIISLHASKPGTYKVSFNVVDSTGKKRGSYKMTVQAVTSSSVLKTVTFGGKTVYSSTYKSKSNSETYSCKDATKVSGSSGKLKVTLNSQYKLTSIIVISTDKNGKYTYKKVKNGGNISLSKALANKATGTNGYYSKSAKKRTYICLSYKDKFLGDTVTCTISKSRGIKEVKYVRKNGQTGAKSVSYDSTRSDLELWQY